MAAAFLAVSLSGCTQPRFAYVANAGFFDNTISMYTVNAATGQLRANGYVLAGDTPMSVAVDPLNRFAYAVNYWSNDISEYQIFSSNGRLTEIAGSPLPMGAGFQPISVTVDPTGRFVYIANNFPGFQEGISAYVINANTGSLTEIPGSPYNTGGGQSSSVTVEPTGHFAYVANYLTNNISAFAINGTTGALNPVSGSPFAAGTSPTSLVVEPLGQYAYAVNKWSNNVSAYTINSTTGALAPVPGSPFSAGNLPEYIAVDPKGRFAYVSSAGSSVGFTNGIFEYSINRSTGDLTPLLVSPFPANFPGALRVDPSGQFLYVTNDRESNDVGTYRIDPVSGVLSILGSIRTRDIPSSIAISSGTAPVTYTPTFAYAANAFDASLSAFSINTTTGGLTPVPGSPFAAGNGGYSIAIDSEARFAYLTEEALFGGGMYEGAVLGFTIDSLSGALTPIAGSPFAGAGNMPVPLTVDPSDRFLYVADTGSKNVSAFKIDPGSGIPTLIFPHNPIATTSNPQLVAVDPTGRFLYVPGADNTADNSISTYLIDSITGYPNQMTTFRPPFAPAQAPVSVAVDPSGKFLYVGTGNGLNPVIWANAIDSVTGALTPIPGSPFAVPARDLVSMTIDPSGRFLYAADVCCTAPNSNSSQVFAFSIDPSIGALTQIAGSPFILQVAAEFGSTFDLSVDPSGRFLYVEQGGSWLVNLPGSVSAYTIDPTTGAVSQSPIAGSPFTTGLGGQEVKTTGKIQ